MLRADKTCFTVQQGRCPTCGQLVVCPPNAVECSVEGCGGLAGWSVSVDPDSPSGFVAGNFCAEHVGPELAKRVTNKTLQCTPIISRE